MKFLIIKFCLTILVLAVALAAGLFFYGQQKFKTPASNAVEKIITIQKGIGSRAIADQLSAQDLISDPYVFVVAAKLMPPQDTLKAGEYQFPAHVPMAVVIDKLKKGDTYKRQFTIPEGLTSYEMMERLRAVPELTLDDVVLPPEGTMLPDTYQYQKNEKLSSVVVRMQTAMTEFLEAEWPKRDQGLPVATPDQAIILASIIEKETGVASERPRISGVFVNRLRQNIPLQTDPTVIYALTKGQPKNDGQGPLGRRLLTKDLEIDSLYNTYKYLGLPPGPIANPGRDAILAALHPETHGYIYFVADGTGGHVFAQTLDEHNQNVAKWRESRRKAGNPE